MTDTIFDHVFVCPGCKRTIQIETYSCYFCPMPCGYRHFVMEDHERITRCIQGHRITDGKTCCEVITSGFGVMMIRVGAHNILSKVS